MTGRRALVTGAAGHIGKAVCEALLELGASVIVSDRDAAACDRRVGELDAAGHQPASPLAIDLEDETSIRTGMRSALGEHDDLDILVHCASLVGASTQAGWSVPFNDQLLEPWDSALRVNLTSAFLLVQEARQALAAKGRGSVILFGSIYGLVGPDLRLYSETTMGNPAGYAASKGGLLALTRYMATVLAPEVRVNAITPGGVERGQPASFRDHYTERTPLRRMAAEEDLKGAVAYLASDLSSYVTGHNLVVDGGWTAW